MARVNIVRALQFEEQGGVEIGVCTNAEGLSSDDMRRIAIDTNTSLTTFIHPTEKADVRFIFYTPTVEVDFSAAGCIAAWGAISQEGSLALGGHTQETNIGINRVNTSDLDNPWIFMNVPEQSRTPTYKSDLASVLGIDEVDVVSTDFNSPIHVGMPVVLAQVNGNDCIYGIQPDVRSLIEFQGTYGGSIVAAFTTDTIGSTHAYVRALDPYHGRKEIPASGTAAAAVATAMKLQQVYGDTTRFILEQGFHTQRGSHTTIEFEEPGDSMENYCINGTYQIDQSIDIG